MGEPTGVARLAPVLLLRRLREVMRTVPPEDSARSRLAGVVPLVRCPCTAAPFSANQRWGDRAQRAVAGSQERCC